MPASRRVMSARLEMPASCSARWSITVAENGTRDSGVSPKPLTLGDCCAALPVMVMRCVSCALRSTQRKNAENGKAN